MFSDNEEEPFLTLVDDEETDLFLSLLLLSLTDFVVVVVFLKNEDGAFLPFFLVEEVLEGHSTGFAPAARDFRHIYVQSSIAGAHFC